MIKPGWKLIRAIQGAFLLERRSFLLKQRAFLLPLLLALALWMAGPVIPVQAHANLVRSSPSAGGTLPQFPTTAQLEFSEAVNLADAQFELLNASGLTIAKGASSSSPANPRLVYVSLPSQPDGVYTLVWKVQSAVDGHITNGSIAFSVGRNAPQVSLLPPVGTPDPASELPPAVEAFSRWIGYLGVALCAGSGAFAIAVWRPAYRQVSTKQLRWDAIVSDWLRWVMRIGVSLTAAGLVGVLLWQRSQFTPLSLGSALLQNLAATFVQQASGLFWIQLLLLLLLEILSFFLPSAGDDAALPWWLGMALSAGLLLTFSLSGHNAALGSPLAVAGDWLHLAGMSVWLGGLPNLAWLLLRQKRLADPDIAPAMIRAVERFSMIARSAVVLLGVTGLYSAFLQVQTFEALYATRYGQAILVKSGVFALLILLGAANERLIMPRMRQPGLPTLAQLGKTVRVEAGLGVALLFGVGALMSLAPAHDALQADYRMGIHDQWQGAGVKMDFRVAPARVGDNEMGLVISDHRPGAQSVQPMVLLRIQAELEDTGITQVEAKAAGGRYTVRGSYFSRMEPWLVEVIWRKAGFDDVTHTFIVDLAQHAADLGEKVNPLPATSASIDAGQVVYQQNCVPCHGADAKGDGPLARTMDPAPADLTYHMAPGVHPDGDIFNWISNGFPGSAMPAFKDHLSEQQRWNVINYLRFIAEAK